ncbi:MAG TPA: N-acetyl-gamma-glutamyl-phosphate reductase [Solirubrobacterales bacterium]|nr:N-acetyl-gamma-glutamyl-phosphate reductase [Solirubrobacterales bacterium]
MSERVLVAGASGYAGALAAELVRRHPSLELARVTARTDAGRRLDELYPQYGVDLLLEEPAAEEGSDVDAAIVAYPHRAAAPVVAALRGQDVKVVDLSADFRLHDLDTYARWYGEHGAPELLRDAVYGLTELHREAIAGADLVASPGCYPTASLLALAPLAAEGLVEDVVIDAKSGISGAGKAAAEEMAVVKEDDDTRPYKVTAHRHTPEIAQELGELAGGNGSFPVTFVPHLMPYHQGELVSCYVRTADGVDMSRLLGLYEARYGDEAFVEVTPEPPGVSGVRETNLCRIHLAQNEASGRVLAFASIDNLWKGAASQAIQNLNLMLGLPEGEGIS